MAADLRVNRSSANKEEDEVDHLTDLLVKSMESSAEPDFFGRHTRITSLFIISQPLIQCLTVLHCTGRSSNSSRITSSANVPICSHSVDDWLRRFLCNLLDRLVAHANCKGIIFCQQLCKCHPFSWHLHFLWCCYCCCRLLPFWLCSLKSVVCLGAFRSTMHTHTVYLLQQ